MRVLYPILAGVVLVGLCATLAAGLAEQQQPALTGQGQTAPVATQPAPASTPSGEHPGAIERGTTEAGRATGEALNTAAKAVGKAFEKTGDALRHAGQWIGEHTGD